MELKSSVYSSFGIGVIVGWLMFSILLIYVSRKIT